MSRNYARLEIERRWLVLSDVTSVVAFAPFSDIEDRYITGTRLRLRTMSAADGSVQRKFGKKYARLGNEAYESITNLYLSESEFQVLASLQGTVARKRRYRLADGSIDVYTSPRQLAVFEVEFESEAEAASYVPPPFVGREITGEESYSGAALAEPAT